MHYRRNHRVPVHLFIDQFRGQEHWIGLSFNLSVGGLYLCQRPQAIPGEMGIELDLPGLDDTIWTKAEVRSVGSLGGFMSISMAFTAMANMHRSLLGDWVQTVRTQLQADRYDRRSPARQLLAA